MLLYIKRLFQWWNGATIGTFFDVLRRAEFIGKDEYGNRYYQERKKSLEGRKRRFVLYNGYAEASTIPAKWHGWLHYTFDQPPTKQKLVTKKWEKEHRPNLTGTRFAYSPQGSLNKQANRKKISSDYEAWNPDEKNQKD